MATTAWLSLTGPCNASCSTTGPPARAFCHHTCWAYRWLFLPRRAWAGHILKKLPYENLLHLATSDLSPTLRQRIIRTANLYSIITVLLYTLCTDSEHTPQALILGGFRKFSKEPPQRTLLGGTREWVTSKRGPSLRAPEKISQTHSGSEF